MEVIRHENHRIDTKGMIRPGFIDGLMEPLTGIVICKECRAAGGNDGKEETPTRDLRATVIRHARASPANGGQACPPYITYRRFIIRKDSGGRACLPYAIFIIQCSTFIIVSSFSLQHSSLNRHSSSCSRLTSSPLNMSWASARICGTCSAKGLSARQPARSCLSSSPAC